MSDTTITMRHAPFVEAHHQSFSTEVWERSIVALATNPYSTCTFEDSQDAFFGVGYTISSYNSLYSIFGQFMAGIDVEAIWSLLSPDELGDFIKEAVEKLDHTIDTKLLPTFQLSMREINAVESSSFVIGKSVIEEQRVKQRSSIAIEASAALFNVADGKMQQIMNWNLSIVKNYARVMRDFFSTKMTTDEAQYRNLVKNLLWPFEVFDNQRKALGAFHPATAQAVKTETAATKSSVMQALGIIGWTATGAYIGSSYPPYGTVIGAVVGFIIGVAMEFIE